MTDLINIDAWRKDGMPEDQILKALSAAHPDYNVNAMLKDGFEPKQINDALSKIEAPKVNLDTAINFGKRLGGNLLSMATAPLVDQWNAAVQGSPAALIPGAPTLINEGKRIVGAVGTAYDEAKAGDASLHPQNELTGDPRTWTPEQRARAAAEQEAGRSHQLRSLQALGSAVPFFGGMASSAGKEYADTGDVTNLAADLTTMAAGPKILKEAARMAPKAAGAVKALPEGVQNSISAIPEKVSSVANAAKDKISSLDAGTMKRVATLAARIGGITHGGAMGALIALIPDLAELAKGKEEEAPSKAAPEAPKEGLTSRNVFTPAQIEGLKAQGYSPEVIERVAKASQELPKKPVVPTQPVRSSTRPDAGFVSNVDALKAEMEQQRKVAEEKNLASRQEVFDKALEDAQKRHSRALADYGAADPRTAFLEDKLRANYETALENSRKTGVPSRFAPKATESAPEAPAPPVEAPAIPKAPEMIVEPPAQPRAEVKNPERLSDEDYVARQKAKNAEDIKAADPEKVSLAASLLEDINANAKNRHHAINLLAREADITPDLAKAIYYHENPKSLIMEKTDTPVSHPIDAFLTEKIADPVQRKAIGKAIDFVYENSKEMTDKQLQEAVRRNPDFNEFFKNTPKDPVTLKAFIEMLHMAREKATGEDRPIAKQNVVDEVLSKMKGK